MTAYALILNNGNNTYSMVFTKSESTIAVGSTFNSKTYGSLPVVAVYTGFESVEYAKAADRPWNGYSAQITSVTVESEISPTSMKVWFANFSICTDIDVALIKTTNVTSLYGTFSGCAKLINIVGLSNWNTSKVYTMMVAFQNCSALRQLDISNWDVGAVTTMYMTFNGCSSLESVNVSHWNTKSITDMTAMFRNCSSLASLDVSNWNTSAVTSMREMFSKCTALTKLDVSNWDVSSVTNFIRTFAGNDFVGDMKIAYLDVSHWDTSSATTMSSMFYGCGKIKELDLSSWDVSNVTEMYHMFADCFSLEKIKFGTWNTQKVTILDGIFNSCMKLKTIDVSTWDTSSCIAFNQVFDGCNALVEILGLNNFNTSKGKAFEEMFNGCHSLVSLDLSSFDTRNAADGAYIQSNDNQAISAFARMFSSMNKLGKITLGPNFSFTGNGSATPFVMPSPMVKGNDGNWYTLDGTAYAPSEIPSNTENTYYAVRVKNNSIFLAFERFWQHISAALRNKADKSHTHDNRYCSQEEIQEYIDDTISNGEW